MTTAHLFYIPVILFVGMIVGFFLGRRAAEQELEQRRRKLARRRAMKKKRSAKKREDKPSKPVATASEQAE